MKKMFILLLVCFLTCSVWALQKNVASQEIGVYAYSTITGLAETGDAANITAYIWQDWVSGAVVADTNPTELDSTNAPGIYVFDITQADSNGDAIHLYAVSATANIELDPVTYHTTPAGFPALNIASGVVEANMKQVSDDPDAADNLEATYDGTGYGDDVAPATQLQITTLAGGIAVSTTATSSTVAEGVEAFTYTATASHDGVYYEVASEDPNDDIDFVLTFNTGDGMNLPVTLHFHGYYEDDNGAPSSTMVIQSYNFNIADWETIYTLTDSASDIELALPLHIHDVDPDGGNAGDVRIRFNLVTPEVDQNVRIDHLTVGYVTGGLTASAIVDEWESQSQADPTDFHVNTMEWLGTAVNEDTAGYPVVTVKDGTGTGEINTASGVVSAQLADGVTHGGSDATLRLKSVQIINPDPGEVAVIIDGDSIGMGIVGGITGVSVQGETIYGISIVGVDKAINAAEIDAILEDTNELQTDWKQDGRLDLLLDIVLAYWDSLTITDGYLETDMKKLDGTDVKSTSGNIHALPGNI